MCTLVLLHRPDHARWPLIVGANRDEQSGRPCRPPARHWTDRPEVTAGYDELAGGSWLGINDHGMMAGILNRQGTLGPKAGKRSRGELVLEALDHAEAPLAAKALTAINPDAYRPFNLIIADPQHAFWIRHAGDGEVTSHPIARGLAMIASGELDDTGSARIRRYRPLFMQATPPDPDKGDWSDWQLLLASRASETGDPRDALSIHTDTGYGTRSSSLIAIPPDTSAQPVWLYCEGPPDSGTWQALSSGP